MVIKLYTGFTKKRNSTKLPESYITYIEVTGTLKQPCTMMQPVFQIERLANDAVPCNYTYAYIADFNRYYFVSDWKWSFPFWEATLAVDVLASYRTEIGNCTEYVLRCDNVVTGGWDPLITDTLYPTTNDFQTDHIAMQNTDFVLGISNGCYIVGVISNDNSDSVGAINYYAMTSTEFGALKNALLSNANLAAMDLTTGGTWDNNDMSEQIFKTMYNPFQYIASCMWFPFTKSKVTTETARAVKVGWWTYNNITASPVFAQVIRFVDCETTTIPAHPQASLRGDYLNFAPYTRMTLFGRFGTLPLDPSYTKAGWKLHIDYYIDIITGQARAYIYTFDGSLVEADTIVLADRVFGLGVPIQLAQIGEDYLGEAVSVVDTAANVMGSVTSLNLGGMASAAAHGIYNTLQASMPQMATSGANGSFLSPYTITRLLVHHYKIVEENVEHNGRPLCQGRTINGMNGYVLCADGEFDISCLDAERTMIADFMTGGFFWE